MADRRTHVSPVTELFSPDQRTGIVRRGRRGRRIRKLKSMLRMLWSNHPVLPPGSYKARRLPRRIV